MSARKLLANKHNLTFGPYRLRTREGVLERDGQPVAISEKTLEVLCVLLESPGELVERETLKQKVWPGTFVEDTNIAFQISTLRKVLEESANAPQFIATVPKRGYRFVAEVVEEREDPEPPGHTSVEWHAEAPVDRTHAATAFSFRTIWISTAILVALVFAVLAWNGSRPPSVTALTEKGSIVLADFANKTGEPVFDGILRQGLLVELEQSPFLSLLSEQRIQRTLRLMRQPPGTPLTHDMAMEVCERTGSTLIAEGSMERVGALYVLGLRALSCEGGRLVAAEQAKALSRERVLDALSAMAARFRTRVGETATTLQRHNASLAEATTASLEALQAYTTGWHVHMTRGATEAIPLLRHAVELDPEFALAYAALGRLYADLDESERSAESLQKAWDLREHASARERFFIAANYLSLVTGNLEEARQVAEAWARTYPREATPHTLLSGILNKAVARHEEAAAQASRAIQLDPDFGMSYYNLAVNYLYLQQLDQAASVLANAAKRGLDIEEFRMLEYDLAFLRQDTEAIQRIVSQTHQRLRPVSWLVNREAFRVAYAGQLRRARSISEQAIAEAERTGERERAGVWEAGLALREALTGNRSLAKKSALSALRLSSDREVEYGAGLALALAGESGQAQTIVHTLERRFPEDTTVRFTYLPVLRAQIELNHRRPAQAVEALKQAVPTEMGMSRSPVNTLFGALYPIYFRGLAFCAAGRGAEAVTEFQKIIAHSGLVMTDPVGVLAHVQLGRAYRLAGDRLKAKAAYEAFFALWRNADAEVPLLRTARAEYQKMQAQ
jgi:DNA-binding winged helix-turn-helix (wHTH) protein